MVDQPNGPVALITGASGGIGNATVSLFRSEGWYVVGMDRSRQELSEADQFITVDLADDGDLKRAFESLTNLGRVRALVNNAGISRSQPLVGTTSAEWDEVMAINVRAAFLCMQSTHALMKNGGGAIVNVSSIHALATSLDVAAYAASKGALVALTRAAALEFGADRIRVNAVLPGAVDTPMLGRPSDGDDRRRSIAARTPLGRIADPREIAQVILFLADEERSSFITGEAIVVDGGAIARLSTE